MLRPALIQTDAGEGEATNKEIKEAADQWAFLVRVPKIEAIR